MPAAAASAGHPPRTDALPSWPSGAGHTAAPAPNALAPTPDALGPRGPLPKSLRPWSAADALSRLGILRRRLFGKQAYSREVGLPLALLVLFNALGTLSAKWLDEGYASLIFVCGITVIGAVSGLVLALISAVVGALIFNFFVAAPLYDISLNKGTDFVAPTIFLLCAIISGLLSGRLKDQSARVQRSNRQLESLLDASRHMQRAGNVDEVFAALRASRLEEIGLRLALYRLHEGVPMPVGDHAAADEWRVLAGEIAALGVEQRSTGGLSAFRLTGSSGAVGVLVTDTPDLGSDRSAVDLGFLAALAKVIGLALERAQLASQVASQIAEVRALERTEELKTNLLSSVSHDLRTPLTTITTAAASLSAFGAQLGDETRADLLADIVSECGRLNHLTSNLLELTRLQAGAEKLHATVIPAAEMLRAMINAVTPHAGSRLVTLVAPREEVLIEADMVLFELALTNVLHNAVRYSPDGSTIALTCSSQGETCVIAVTDAGIGIPFAEQARVFERFYRVAPARLKDGAAGGAVRGSGLGLAIAKGFVEASGGTIAVASPVADGRGTTITIRLPRVGGSGTRAEARR